MKKLIKLVFLVALTSCGVTHTTDLPSLEKTLAGGGGQTPSGTITDFKLSCEEARFVYFLNIYRRSQNVSALSVSKAGVLSTRWHAEDMINKNYFSHTEPNGRGFSARAADFGYGAWAENIAAGNTSAEGTFCQWRNSPGHNSNMLGNHSSIGIGNVTGGGQYGSYWSNNFGPGSSDQIAEPLTTDAGCVMPTVLPGC